MSALGLADYGSSDEEDAAVEQNAVVLDNVTASKPSGHFTAAGVEDALDHDLRGSAATQHDGNAPNKDDASAVESPQAEIVGPDRPPSVSGSVVSQQDALPEADPSLSPYSQRRQQIRLLTMPPIPNFDIPPLPPNEGLDRELAAANKKVQHFLALKRQGTHFHQRLLTSTAMMNTAMTDRLMAFAGVQGPLQYVNALPDGLGPDIERWASVSVEKVVATMEERRKQESEGRKGKQREFVSAGAQRSDSAVRRKG